MIVIEVREVSETNQVVYTHIYMVKPAYKSDFQAACELTALIQEFKRNEE